MDILNKTPRPLKISLPGGKVLRLGPKMTGQISPKAAEHPPVKKLLEEGVIEIQGDGGTRSTGGGSNSDSANGSNQSGSSGGAAMRRSGDR
ncbi:MAG: hypothetical protein COA70_08475 [Planctomycetota bacterium]|nr:MAG: hypothetical protein COA70_08475 [Planctomycetota bacterium]